MGYRAHVCRKYEVVYGEGCLNWNNDFLSRLFSKYCPSFNSQGDAFLEMELTFDDLNGLIYELQSMSNDDFIKLLTNDKERREISRAYIISSLVSLYEDGDKRNEHIHIHWF